MHNIPIVDFTSKANAKRTVKNSFIARFDFGKL